MGYEKREVHELKTEFQARLEEREKKAGLTDDDLQILPQEEKYERLAKEIGDTPKIEIVLPNNNVLIQSDETANPAESHYDRVYIHLLHELEKEGNIKPGNTLLETTSGNAGISFAWIAKKLGYKPIVFAPDFIPEPRRKELEYLADDVKYSDDKKRYLQACSRMMVRYYKENRDVIQKQGSDIYMPNHSVNHHTPEAFHGIADEIKNEHPNKQFDYFIGGVGNGSTLLGIAERLKELYPEIKGIGFEPKNACPYYKGYKDQLSNEAPHFVQDQEIPDDYSFHELPGTGGFGNTTFPFMRDAIDKGLIDDIVVVPDAELLKKIQYNSGVPPEQQQGHTSLIARYIAETMAQKVSGKNFISLVYDKDDRYGKPRYKT